LAAAKPRLRYTHGMGGKRIAEQLRRALIAAAKVAPVVVAIVVSCGGESGGGTAGQKAQATCVRVCEMETSCAGPPLAGRDCERFCTRRGADAGWFGLGSAGVSSSCDSDSALAKLNACVDRGCNGLEDCEACVCGDLSRCPMDGG